MHPAEPTHASMTVSFLWPAGRPSALPPPGEVHVWAVPLDGGGRPPVSEFAATLSADERARAARFRVNGLSERFIAARGQLRVLLAFYLGREPSELRFNYDANRKPSLATDDAQQRLSFNLSHAGDVALIAVTESDPVGVDVERVRAFGDMRSVAKQFFSPAERAELDRARPDEFESAFYRCWTRKEAFLKANGIGLLRPLDSFDVSILTDSAPGLLRVADSPEAPGRWSIVHLDPAPGYVGALAVECRELSVRTWYANIL